MVSACYIFNSGMRNKYAGDLPLFLLNLYIYGARSVALDLVYLRRTIGQLPHKSFWKHTRLRQRRFKDRLRAPSKKFLIQPPNGFRWLDVTLAC
jgi:hypothetical protein